MQPNKCGVWNEAGQRLIEFCQENTLVIANTLFQQYKIPPPSASSGGPGNRLGMQPWALSLPDQELCLRQTPTPQTNPLTEQLGWAGWSVRDLLLCHVGGEWPALCCSLGANAAASSKATLWTKAQNEGSLALPCIIR